MIVLIGLIAAAWLTLIFTDKTPETASPKPHRTPIAESPDTLSSIPTDSTARPLQKIKAFVLKENPGIPATATQNSRRTYVYTEKYPIGTILELNTADTAALKKIPGIGSVFSNRIVKYRNLLGGFYSVAQLSEVYGIDEDRYHALKGWFSADPTLIHKRSLNTLSADSLYRHPYLSRPQVRAILQQRRQKGYLSGWNSLWLLDEFANIDKERIEAYFTFE